MKKFAAITLILVAASCHSSPKVNEEVAPEPAPALISLHVDGVSSLRNAATMADLVTIEADLRDLREIMRSEVTSIAEIQMLQVMQGQAILAAQAREEELKAARIAALDECLRKIAKIRTMAPKGADIERVVQSIRVCVSCAEDHQTEDFLLKTEAEAERVRKEAYAVIASLCAV